jgi:mRNA-degrading endonuclease RelE of RelBE toxin-antitoxin system
MVFIESQLFSRLVYRYLSEREYSGLQQHLAAQPDAGDLIRGSGGARKIRWLSEGRGKSGGVRVIYYWITTEAQILLLTIYSKSEQGNLTAAELKRISQRIKELKQ